MKDHTQRYLTEWAPKRDAWVASGRKDDSCLLRGDDLHAFRTFVINEPRRVTSDDRGFLLACDRRADTSAIMRSQDLESLHIEHEDPSVSAVIAEAGRQSRGQRWAYGILAVNVVLLIGMLGFGWIVHSLVVQLREAKGELQKTQATLLKKNAEIGQVHEDLTQKSRAKEALDKALPAVQAQRDDATKVLDSLTQSRRSAEEQLKAVESALALAQDAFTKQRGRKPKGKLKVEYDRLLARRLLLMLPPRCPVDLADCSDDAIKDSVHKLLPRGSLLDVLLPVPHAILYPRTAASSTKLLPLRDTQLRKLLKAPGEKSDLFVIICPRLPEERRPALEARYQLLLTTLQKSLKLAPERIVRLNQTALLTSITLKWLPPPDRPKPGEQSSPETLWVIRTPGPRPLPVSPAQPS